MDSKLASSDDIFVNFEVPKIVEWVKDNDYKRIALQFPPNYLDVAPEIIMELETRLTDGRELFILADTSYRSCCLDEIAAEHANCDSLVHFGDACLSSESGKLPVLYIFGKQRIDFDDFKKQISSSLPNLPTGSDEIGRLLILCDSIYSSLEDEIESAIKSIFCSSKAAIHLCKIQKPQAQSTSTGVLHILGRRLPPADGEPDEAGNEELLIFVGARESPLLALFRLTLPGLRRVLHYIPEENCAQYSEFSTNKMLMKRLYLVEKMRDSRTVGLVIGSASMQGCREAIARIRKLCAQANKKLYVFYIGKLNEAKLTNFGTDVDIFVMLSCPYGILLDDKRFYKPVVSFFEAEMALNQNSNHNYSTDFGWTAELGKILKNDIRPLEDEMADFSLTSGTIRSQEKQSLAGGEEGQQLVEYSAGDYFAQRTWKGLDDGSVPNQTTRLKEGRSGIASGYEQEPEASK